jgi:tripartite-type tricarboxylate transporter receptor subunit TctC
MSSAGIGSAPHVAGELFKMMTSVKMVHVPYRGASPSLNDLIAGQVQVTFESMPSSIGYVRAGTLRALAVTTAERSEALPATPTIAEFVPGYEASIWYGVGVPKNTPAPIIEKLNSEINVGLADQKLHDRGKPLATPAPRQPSPLSTRRQIPIAAAAPPAHYLPPRFRALALFERRYIGAA